MQWRMIISGPCLEVEESKLASVVGMLEGGKKVARWRSWSQDNIATTAGECQVLYMKGETQGGHVCWVEWAVSGGVCSSVMLQDRTVMSTCEHTSHVISYTCSEVIFRLQCTEVCGACSAEDILPTYSTYYILLQTGTYDGHHLPTHEVNN